MIENILLVIAGFIFLIKGADFFIKGAAALAKNFHISEIFIGLTVVAFGTSCPELFVNIISSLKGTTSITLGNIVGSNVANLLLILGMSSLFYPLKVNSRTFSREIPFSLLASVALGIMLNDTYLDKCSSQLSRSDGLVLLCFFSVFAAYTLSIMTGKEIKEMEDNIPDTVFPFSKIFLDICLGFTGLIFGGKWVIEGAVSITEILGISQSLVGLTLVAFGTSLPELVTSLMAGYRKKHDIAIGNIVGSGIFNIFFILGISSVIQPIQFSAILNADLLVLIFAHFIILVFIQKNSRSISRAKGTFLFIAYLFYLAFLVSRG